MVNEKPIDVESIEGNETYDSVSILYSEFNGRSLNKFGDTDILLGAAVCYKDGTGYWMLDIYDDIEDGFRIQLSKLRTEFGGEDIRCFNTQYEWYVDSIDQANMVLNKLNSYNSMNQIR